MHESTITEKILRIVLDEAKSHQVKQITKIKIVVGDLSGIVEDSVELYFRLIAKDTIAERAKLEFIRTKARLFCVQCNLEFDKNSQDFNCPNCGNLSKLTETGRECFVESIEVED